MPLYDFKCDGCMKYYDAFAAYDTDGVYAGVTCPTCGSDSKRRIPSRISIGQTSSKFDNFSYRAGFNMENAKAERRHAEAHSHMGTNVFDAIDDTPLDVGIHDNENAGDDCWL